MCVRVRVTVDRESVTVYPGEVQHRMVWSNSPPEVSSLPPLAPPTMSEPPPLLDPKSRQGATLP